jgi:membrane dipeptidase
VSFTYNQIDLLNRLLTEYPAHFSQPPNSSTALSAFRNGQIISPIAIEGLHQIGNSISNLRNYYGLGVRYATLTHNCHNKYADAALLEVSGGGLKKSSPFWGGISPAGRDLIHEMNRLGMIVDLSHVSYDTMRDVLGGKNDSWTGSLAPPIFSHSSAYALCPHPRNVPDDILQLVKKRNSIVMVNFSPDFVSCVASDNKNGLPDFFPNNSTLAHVVEHIMHIGQLIGYDHVGIGSDFDGIPTVPEGLEDVSKFPDLIAKLLEEGVSDSDAAKVAGGNLLRVWADVDDVALKMQERKETPLEDELSGLEF